MRGLDELKELRRRRMVPASGVCVSVTEYPQFLAQFDDELLLCIDPRESLDRIDWRPFVGIDTVVACHAFDEQPRALRAVCAALVAAGSRKVIGVQYHYEADPETLFVHR